MPTLTPDQADAILIYLTIEGFKQKSIIALSQDIEDLLADNGYSIPTYTHGRGKGNPYIAPGRQYSSQITNNFNDAFIANNIGLADEGEADNYTRYIYAAGGSTGTSKSAKVNSAGDPLPSRNLGPEYFDHNGMMATNILSIAASGLPDPTWIASAKLTAGGQSYLAQFPANWGATYALGSRGIHPNASGVVATPTPTPAPTPTPTPTPTPAVTPTPDDEEEETEVVEEVEVEVTPQHYVYPDEIQAVSPPKIEVTRGLNDSTWSIRENNNDGLYPYPANDLIIHLTPADSKYQPDSTSSDFGEIDLFGDDEGDEIELTVETAQTPPGSIFLKDGQLYFQVGKDIISVGDPVNPPIEVVWNQDGTIKNVNIDDLLIIENGKMIKCDYLGSIEKGQTALQGGNGYWLSSNYFYEPVPETIYTVPGDFIDSEFGLTSDSSSRDDYLEALSKHRSTEPSLFAYYTDKVTVEATPDVYLGGFEDFDGTEKDEIYWLGRQAAQTDEDLNIATQYLKVQLNLSGDAASNTNLFVGYQIPETNTRIETLIFPGDEKRLNLLLTPYSEEKTVLNALFPPDFNEDTLQNLQSSGLLLKEIKTSVPTNEVDEDGNLITQDLVMDATLVFHDPTGTTTDEIEVPIPNKDGEFGAVDSFGGILRGSVEAIQIVSGDSEVALNQENLRRHSDRLNTQTPKINGHNVTNTIVFQKNGKYYIVGQHNGKPVIVKLDLSIK